MAKLCISCGQPLLKDDARFCNECGQAQNPSPGPVESSAIKVKLPPREFFRAEVPSAWQEKSASEPALRLQPLSGPAAAHPAHPIEPAANAVSASAHFAAPDLSDDAALPSPASVEQVSTMVLPGWQDELARYRQDLSDSTPPTLPAKVPEPTFPPSSSRPVARSGMPPQRQKRPISESLHDPMAGASVEQKARPKAAEPAPAVRPPQVSAEQNASGPAAAIGLNPLPQLPFETDEESVRPMADLDTVLWQTVSKPLSPVSDFDGDHVVGTDASLAGLAQTSVAAELDVEDLPTTPLAVPEMIRNRSGVAGERPSTPASIARNTLPAAPDHIENQPTMPMVLDGGLRSPLSPIPAGPDRQPPPRAGHAPVGVVQHPITPPPILPAPGSGPAPFAQPANPVQRPGPAFDPGNWSPAREPMSLSGLLHQTPPPTLPYGPPLLSSNAPFKPPAATVPDAPPTAEAAQLTAVPASASPTEKPRTKKGPGRLVAGILLFLLLAGGGAWYILFQHPLTNSLVNPYQSYQNNLLGFGLHYPLGWTASADQAHASVHFTDSTQTGQANLIVAPANGQALTHYFTAELASMGVTAQKNEPGIFFAQTTWSQVMGSVTQNGATYTITLYVTQHSNRFYTLTCQSPPGAYNQMEQADFTLMRQGFLFL